MLSGKSHGRQPLAGDRLGVVGAAGIEPATLGLESLRLQIHNFCLQLTALAGHPFLEFLFCAAS
jgi:hypothetical protein